MTWKLYVIIQLHQLTREIWILLVHVFDDEEIETLTLNGIKVTNIVLQ